MHVGIACHLGGEGVDVTFTVNSQSPDAPRMSASLAGASGLEVVRLPLGRPQAGGSLRARLLAALCNAIMIWSFVRLVRLVRAAHVDVLHTTDRPRDALLCTLLGAVTRRPTVVHMHSNYYPSMSRFTLWGFRHASAVVGISRFTTNSVAQAGVKPERLSTIPNAVDAGYFDPARVSPGALRAELAIPANVPLIGLVGRFIPYKGHADLIEALALLPERLDVHVVFVGKLESGPDDYVARLREQAAGLGLRSRIHFAGYRDPRAIYPDLDVLAVPSWEEPFGLVVAEALAMRVPVVAYRSGGIPEIVRNSVDGLLVTPRAVDELAAALTHLIERPALRQTLGAAGRAHVLAAFTPERQAAEVAALYQRIAAKEGHGSHATTLSGHPTGTPGLYE
ncbi:MAG TPA: glycosyltransferase family 4 protein [Dehalococcoidia bacterium]|nr:glycosyltransferase family 4 protein [Dehalococcoidia bacterium]